MRVFEIAASQPRLLLQVSVNAPFPSLVELLSDRRVRAEAADGRQALARSERRYDVIEVDALYLTSAGSGNLYSVEFFELCARRLKPGGLVCSQKPSRRVGLTFSEALPHVLDFGNMVIGSNEAIPIDLAAWEARLARAGAGAALRRRDARGDPRAARRGRARRAQPHGPRRLQPRPLPARRVRHPRGLVSVTGGDGLGVPAELRHGLRASPGRSVEPGHGREPRVARRSWLGSAAERPIHSGPPEPGAHGTCDAGPYQISSRLFQSGVVGVRSLESAFSTANVAIFSTAHGKWASLRLR